MPRMWLVAGVTVVLVGVGAGLIVFTRNKSPAVKTVASPPPEPHRVASSPAAPAEIALSGKIEPANVINVPAPVDGTVEQLMAEVGDVALEGRVLAHIKNPNLASAVDTASQELERGRNRVTMLESGLIAARLEVSRSEADEARARLEFAKAEKEYQRQKLMFGQGITPRLVFEKSEQDYKALKSDSEKLAEAAKNAGNRVSDLAQELESSRHELDQQKDALDKARAGNIAGDVRSPAEGIIVARCCQAGEPVSAGSTLFQISSDLTALHVEAAADPESIARIRPGQAAVVEIVGASGTAPGKVREVKEGEAIVDFTSPSPDVRPGMMARVKIKVS